MDGILLEARGVSGDGALSDGDRVLLAIPGIAEPERGTGNAAPSDAIGEP